MNHPASRRRLLRALLHERVLVLDGAMGTQLQQAAATGDDGAREHDGCLEDLVRSNPAVVRDVHDAYARAGADILSTNTFGASRIVLAEYGLGGDTYAINVAAARLARQVADGWSDRPRFVAGAMGPTTKAISVTGGMTFGELQEAFAEQALGLLDGGVDLLLLETCQDTRNVKAALLAIEQLARRVGPVPLMLSATIEPSGTMLGGQTIEAFCASTAHSDLVAIGLNCGAGGEALAPHVDVLQRVATCAVSCHPNAGLPDADGGYAQTATTFAAHLAPLLERGWLNVVGGCCGTTEAHIRALAAVAADAPPRRHRGRRGRIVYTGVDLVSVTDAARPIVIGERANVVGSRAFKRLIEAKRWDEACDVARQQVAHGAQIVDVCLQSADGDECADIPPFYERLTRSVRAPLMIDTTDPAALELALTYCQGRSLVNSANLEDGGARLDETCRIVQRYGAALVLGCIDNHATEPQALTRERKLAVAERAYWRAITAGLRPEDIVIDPLVFPCASGDPAYIGAAVETIESLALIRTRLPRSATVLGISNVSFGLPAAARRVVDSVFLAHCTAAGLDMAIANPQSLTAIDDIPAAERDLAENLLFNRPVRELETDIGAAPDDWRSQSPEHRVAISRHHVAAITSHFRAAPAAAVPAAALSVDGRIARGVVTGTRTGLVEDLRLKLDGGTAPLDLINGPLMDGMNEVARLFRDNRMIVAEVLMSAEVMRAGVHYLESFIDASEVASRGTVLLATVKGDVHDIGKDLVKIIVANNGYSVVDLGTRVAPDCLIAAVRTHRPVAIGLSGLLVKSAHQMVATAAALRAEDIATPLLVGGAALTAEFTRTRIAPAYGGPVHYAADAMSGLALLRDIGSGDAARRVEPGAPAAVPTAAAAPVMPTTPLRRATRTTSTNQVPIPPAPYLERRVERPAVADVWPLLNPFMLFNRHLGLRGDLGRRTADGDPTALALTRVVGEVQRDAASFIAPRALWQFFEAEREGDRLDLFAPGAETPLHSFHFQRQREEGGACLTDYVLPATGGARDHVALFVVTAGPGIRAQAQEWSAAGDFLKAHALQALGLETAEACAEWLHKRIRADWGFPDPPSLSPKDLFTSRYRGKRYSFGYPACPNLDDQRGLWRLLDPADIGVQLTDGMMMDPEASVSGIVFHHPDCAYFAVGTRDERDSVVGHVGS